MVKRITGYMWRSRHQFVKYFIVGVSGVIIDMITLIFFKEKLHVIPVVAVASNQAIVLCFNFILNKYWSFRNKALPHKQLVRYLTLAGWNYLFSVISMYIFSDLIGYDYRLVRIVTIIIAVGWNFLLYKHWVYGDMPKKDEPTNRE